MPPDDRVCLRASCLCGGHSVGQAAEIEDAEGATLRLREFSGLDYITLLFSVSISSLAAGPDEAGFWPVISWPSATV